MTQRPATEAPVVGVDVALTPAFLHRDSSDGTFATGVVYIVVDVIRATTTLSVLFEQGCRRVLLAPSIEGARVAQRALGGDLPLALGWRGQLAGESGGVAPSGFDFGNSPAEFARQDMQGRELIFATTNGTRALRACAGGRAIFAGSFRNARAVAQAALALVSQRPSVAYILSAAGHAAEGNSPGVGEASEAEIGGAASAIVVVCSGRGGRPAYDDTICAGYLVRTILDALPASGSAGALSEGARIALGLYDGVARTTTLYDALAASDAARAITRVGLGDDLRWCVDVDVTDVVPAVSGVGPADLLVVEPYPFASGAGEKDADQGNSVQL